MSDRVVAIDVGGTNLKGALVDRRGQALSVARRPTQAAASVGAVVPGGGNAGVDGGVDAVVDAVVGLARELAEWEGPARPVAVGLAVPGLVDDRTGTVLEATNLRWRNVPIKSIAEDRLGVRVSVSHDVRAGAVAEGLLGAARGHHDYLLLTLGTGIGAAVVIGGQAYTGAHGLGGELGHVAIDPHGPLCGCGRRGCLEALASAGHIASRYSAMRGGGVGLSAMSGGGGGVGQDSAVSGGARGVGQDSAVSGGAGGVGQDSAMSSGAGGAGDYGVARDQGGASLRQPAPPPAESGVDGQRVAALAAAGDPVADSIWREAIDALARAIANYTALLDPELVVIGGGMAAAGDSLFGPLRQRLVDHVRFGQPPPVVPAALGEEAGRRGAAIAAWRAAGIDEAEFAGWVG